MVLKNDDVSFENTKTPSGVRDFGVSLRQSPGSPKNFVKSCKSDKIAPSCEKRHLTRFLIGEFGVGVEKGLKSPKPRTRKKISFKIPE